MSRGDSENEHRRSRTSGYDGEDDAPEATLPESVIEVGTVARGPILARLAVAFAAALVGIALVDRCVAYVDRAQGVAAGARSGAIVRHEELGWTNRPHFENPELETKLDRFGFRSPEIPDDADPTELRIAGFGASRLYGAGGALQSDCWDRHLARMLEQAGHPARVINGGVMGYSTLQAARRAAMALDAIEPDFLFVTVTPGAQMLLDVSAARDAVRYGPDPDDIAPADVLAGWPEPLRPLVAGVHRVLLSGSAIYRRHRAGFQVAGQREAGLQRWLLSAAPQDLVVLELLEGTLQELDRLAAACEQRGIEFAIVLMPEIWQDADDVWERFLREKQEGGAPPIGTPRQEPTRELARRLHARGLRVLDFEPEVDRMGAARSRYLIAGEDFHWSEPGHRLFAAGLAKRITDELAQLASRRRERPRARPYGDYPFGVPPERASAEERP